VIKTLEADPARRYESVRALSVDLQNCLDGRPVAARPQTVAYKAGKFLRRRRLTVIAAATFVLGLAGAAMIAFHQAQVARAEALNAEKVNGFMDGMLRSTGQSSTVVQMLESAEQRLDQTWTSDKKTEAALRRSLGISFCSVLRFDRARVELNKALVEFQSLGDATEVATTLFRLADVAKFEGRTADAVKGYEDVLARLKLLGSAAPQDLVLQTKDHLAHTLYLLMNQRLPEAQKLLEEAIALGNRDSSIPRIDLAIAMSHYAALIWQDGHPDEAEVLFRKALEMGRKEDPNGNWQADVLYGLGVLMSKKDPPAAVELARQRYEILSNNLGPGNAQTAVARLLWARGQARNGHPEEAALQVMEPLEIVRKQFPPGSLDRWVALSSGAYIMNRAKRFQDAERLAREMIPIVEANHLPPNDARRAQTWLELGTALHGEKRNREAAVALSKAVEIYDAAGPAWQGSAKLARKLLVESK
jgi:serine/threonine-protein kinase